MCGLWLVGEGLNCPTVLLVKEGEKTVAKGHEWTRDLGKKRQRSRDACSERGR